MKMNFGKRIILALSLSIWSLVFFISGAHAFGLLTDEFKSGSGGKMSQQDQAFLTASGFAEADDGTLPKIVAQVINVFIGLLGIIFVVLIVYAGYSWMTAAGDESKITKAKETISRSTIGLIIILAAYSITYFVFKSLDSVVSTT